MHGHYNKFIVKMVFSDLIECMFIYIQKINLIKLQKSTIHIRSKISIYFLKEWYLILNFEGNFLYTILHFHFL